MDTVTELRIAATIFSLVGTVLLAWRVTSILKELVQAVKFLDLNEEIRARRANGEMIPNIRTYGSRTHVEKAEQSGLKLLVLGFVFQIFGAACQVLALFLASASN